MFFEVFGRVQTHSDPFGHADTHSDAFGCIWKRLDAFGKIRSFGIFELVCDGFQQKIVCQFRAVQSMLTQLEFKPQSTIVYITLIVYIT